MPATQANRRRFLGGAAALAACGATRAWARRPGFGLASGETDWERLAAWADSLKPPRFPRREFAITRFGARANGASDATAAIAAAIAACHRAGGGRVLVPPGEFQTGPVVLLSNVELHLAAGSTLRFAPDPSRYPLVLTRYEGIELMNYSPLVRAYGESNIAITGQGTLDGGADWQHWWNWAGRRPGAAHGMERAPAGPAASYPPRTQFADRIRLGRMAEEGVPVARRVFGPGHYLRPQFIQPYRCENVLIEGVRLRRSPMYHVHPVLCRNVIVRGLDVASDGPNTDGCDPESCDRVLIEDCRFATGDDCIAVKSGRNADGRRLHVPARDHLIRRCRMERGHGAVTIGSEISGGARAIFVEHCRIGPAVMTALRVKNNAMRGGRIENVQARALAVSRTAQAAVTIDFLYEEGAAGPYTPVCRHVRVEGMRVEACRRALELRGLPRAPIEDVALVRCRFDHAAEPDIIRDVRGFALRDVTINGRPAAAAAAAPAAVRG